MSDEVGLRAEVCLPDKQPVPALINGTPHTKASLPGLMAVINPMRAAQTVREGQKLLIACGRIVHQNPRCWAP